MKSQNIQFKIKEGKEYSVKIKPKEMYDKCELQRQILRKQMIAKKAERELVKQLNKFFSESN